MPSGVIVPLTFEVYKGEQLLQKTTLSQDIIKVGKLSSSHLRIEDESVSRMHAVIEITSPGEISIIDLGSVRGTLVNGQRVNKAKLKSGDEVGLGDIRLVVTVGEPEAVAVDSTQQVDADQLVAALQSEGGSTSPGLPPVQASAAIPPPPGFAAPVAPIALAPMPLVPMNFPGSEEVEVRDGARAVELSAMFEDSVLDVRLFDNPQAGVLSGATKALVGLGSAALLASFIMLLVAYVQVGKVRADREAWLDAGKPYSGFVAPKDSPFLDIGCASALIFGVVTLMWGLFRMFEERGDRDYVIGSDATAHFPVGNLLLGMARLPIVRSTGSDFEALFTQQMSGDLTDGSRRQSLAELVQAGTAKPAADVPGAYVLPIGSDSRLMLRLGENTFNIVGTPKARRFPVPLRIDWEAQAYTGAVFALHALAIFIMFSVPPDPKSLSLDAFMNDQRFAKFLIKPPEQKEEVIPEWLKKKSPDEMGGKGKRHKDEEGKMGKKESKNKAGLYALKGPKDNTDLHLAKQLATDAAQKAGVLGILKGTQGSILSSIFGRDSALGNEAQDVLGGLLGTEVGEAYGVGGLGLVGTGRGGGGTGEGTIGLGNLGTIGKGGGGGSGSGYGRGAGGLGGRRATAPDVVPGTAEVRGSLDKEIIRRIIRRHLNEVKFCYERELVKNAGLSGRVMIQFTIAGTGSVVASAVQSSTMNNPTVEMCIAQSVRRWEFPKPSGGGIVVVTYPFVLKASGGE
ncbi:MAG TPA: AgmX/PglI C-terminal domain-containing protein [Pseudomonadota bacterium]|nr:AgmX/PglI C-terminal domain-containing protein [Pseudomonadota bacterium]